MSYAGSRRIIDVDSHVIELDDFLWNAATPSERERLPKMADQKVLPRARASHAERRGLGEFPTLSPSESGAYSSYALRTAIAGKRVKGEADER